MAYGPEDFAEQRLYRLYNYWLSKRRDGRLPARADLDALEMGYMLGSMAMVAVEREPHLRFRYRLIGHKLAERTGVDLTGRYVDDYPDPKYRELLLSRCNDLVANPRPLISRQHRVIGNRRYDYEAVWLPLAADGVNVDILLAGQIYSEGELI